MSFASEIIAKRIVRDAQSGAVSAHLRILGSPRIDDRRPPRGTGRVGLLHSLDEESGDTEASRDGCRGLTPSRPLPDIAGEAHGFLPGAAHIKRTAGSAPAFPLPLVPRQRW